MGVRHRHAYACDSQADLAAIELQAGQGEIAYCISEGTSWRKIGSQFQMMGFGDCDGPAASVSGNVATFSGTTGKSLQDSGVSPSSFATASHVHAGGDITSGTVAVARLGSGTPSASNYLRGDGSWVTPSGSGDVAGPASAVADRIVLFDGTTGKLIKDSGSLISGLAAASHTHAESDITNLVSDLAGKASTSHSHAQSDVTNLVSDLAAKAPASAFITLTSAFTTAGGTTALQKLFNAPTNGAFTAAANTTYFFECGFSLTAMSATSGTFSFGLGGTATYTSVLYHALANKGAATPVASLLTRGTVATAVALVAANTTTTGGASIKGKFTVTTSGTVIPSFATSIAAASVVANGSYFKLWPAGSNTVQSSGSWS